MLIEIVRMEVLVMSRLGLFGVFSLILIGPLGLSACAELDEPLDEVASAPVESTRNGDFPADRAGESEWGSEATESEPGWASCSADYPIYEPYTADDYDAFCGALAEARCERASNDCAEWDGIHFAEGHSDYDTCMSNLEDACRWLLQDERSVIDSAQAQDCVEELTSGVCSMLSGYIHDAPSCRSAVREIAPDPSHCQTIEAGYHMVSYEDAEDSLEGRSLDTFCICLEEGDTLQLTGSDGDMIIYLFGVDGLDLASTRFQESNDEDGMEPTVLGPILVPETGMYQIGVAAWDEDSVWEEPELSVFVE